MKGTLLRCGTATEGLSLFYFFKVEDKKTRVCVVQLGFVVSTRAMLGIAAEETGEVERFHVDRLTARHGGGRRRRLRGLRSGWRGR